MVAPGSGERRYPTSGAWLVHTAHALPDTWHWSRAEQVTGLLPWHVPLEQVSVWVQALPSLQPAPLGWGKAKQVVHQRNTVTGCRLAQTFERWSVSYVPAPCPYKVCRPGWVVLCPCKTKKMFLYHMQVMLQPGVSSTPMRHDCPRTLLVGGGQPDSGWQVPATWHWSAVQVIGLVPTHFPDEHVSV